MNVRKLIETLERPVDLIKIYGYDIFPLYYDGFETQEMPEGLKNFHIKSWEIVVEVEQQSICELKFNYILKITVDKE